MKALLFGSTGMVGSEALKEAIKNSEITEITVVNRRKVNTDEGVKEIVHDNFLDYSSIKNQLVAYDIVIYCLAVYGGGKLSDEKYYEITHDYTIALAKTIEHEDTTFVFFSAAGTNAQSRMHWAKTKGETENDLMKMKFKKVYALRPGFIRPSDKSKIRNAFSSKLGDAVLYPIFKALAPKTTITSNQIGQSMVKVALEEYEKQILENVDIRRSLGLKRGV
ncbi:MAG: NAD-dependent epimerase/dehydratase family protein [Promethearchaeota archaeon]